MLILGSRLTACPPDPRPMRANGSAASPKAASAPINGVSSPESSSLFGSARPKFDEIEALGRRCHDGDLAAWTLLFPRIWPVLMTFVHRLYPSFDQQDAED